MYAAGFLRQTERRIFFHVGRSGDRQIRKMRKILHTRNGRLEIAVELRGGSVFCNPPYGRSIGLWVEKAYNEAKNGTTIVLLIPSRTDTSYFHDYIYGKAEIRFVRGRLTFTDEDGKPQLNASGKPAPAPFPSMVVIYNGGSGKK